MRLDSVPFCDRINGVVVSAGVDDLRRVVDRMRSSREFSLSLDRISMDSGIELIGTAQGIAVFGCEDSLRGNFGFHYYDPAKPAKLLQVGIYEVPRYALCENLDHAIQIAETFFREGELDRQFSWMIDVNNVRDVLNRDNLLAAGNKLPIEEFVAQVAQQTA
jgi:hypothetical protein